MIDDVDLKIISQLRADGRISVNELSERVHLSQTPVARRLKQLEQNGVIKGYAAIVDEKKIGFGFSVFVSVRLDKQIDDKLAIFEAKIQQMPEVADCWLMTGNYDYLLRIISKDIEGYEKFLLSELTRIDGVATIESSIPLRRVKADGARTF